MQPDLTLIVYRLEAVENGLIKVEKSADDLEKTWNAMRVRVLWIIISVLFTISSGVLIGFINHLY